MVIAFNDAIKGREAMFQTYNFNMGILGAIVPRQLPWPFVLPQLEMLPDREHSYWHETLFYSSSEQRGSTSVC